MVDWTKVKYFTPDEWGEWQKVSPDLIYAVDRFRTYLNKPIFINESWSPGIGHVQDSEHYKGNAVDLWTPSLPLLDFWMFAERFFEFRGIGLYPFWTHPGLHLDIRSSPYRARWWRDRKGVYREWTSADLVDLVSLHAFMA